MQLFHSSSRLSATFDDANLVAAAGLVPAMALAVRTGLGDLADAWLTLPGYFGANAGLKVTALVAGMLAGADSIDDMSLLRHGGAEEAVRGNVRAIDVGIVPAVLHVRSRPPARRRGVAVAGQHLRGHPDRGRDRRLRPGRDRRHHQGGPRIPETGFRLRLLRGARLECADRNRLDARVPRR